MPLQQWAILSASKFPLISPLWCIFPSLWARGPATIPLKVKKSIAIHYELRYKHFALSPQFEHQHCWTNIKYGPAYYDLKLLVDNKYKVSIMDLKLFLLRNYITWTLSCFWWAKFIVSYCMDLRLYKMRKYRENETRTFFFGVWTKEFLFH
jgi:hypothetical protein